MRKLKGYACWISGHERLAAEKERESAVSELAVYLEKRLK